MVDFQGFTENILTFFKNLVQNNNREWFIENKAFYEQYVKNPSIELVNSLSIRFANEGLPYIADKSKSLFRLYRDTRFSNDKSPYKTNLGILFPLNSIHTKVQDVRTIGLYFHFDAKESFVAGGLHFTDTPTANLIRDRIAEEWKDLLSILENKEFKMNFPVLSQDNKLKKAPKGYPADHPAIEILKLKGFTVFGQLMHEQCFHKEFEDTILEKAKIILPFLQYLDEAINVNN
jgi:uncharacterized protein (TIGR02453 family)